MFAKASAVVALLAATLPSFSTAITFQHNSGKRGLCYNNATLTRPYSQAGQNSKVSWAYNWYFQGCPLNTPNCGLNTALDYIPMLYSDASDLTSAWPNAAETAIRNKAIALFSFNEPDACFAGLSSCMTVDAAVAAYKKYMMPYAGRIPIGAPAVTNAGSPYGLTWLQQFMTACTGCRFDFVNVHWYSNKYAGVNYLQSFLNDTKAMAGGRPIWLSEFGLNNDNPYTDAELQSFLKASMTWMDSQSWIAKYAYFMDAPGMLINSAGTGLSADGQLYNNYVQTKREVVFEA